MIKFIILALVLLLTIAITFFGVSHYYKRKIAILIEDNKHVVAENFEIARSIGYKDGLDDGEMNEREKWQNKHPDPDTWA